MNKIHVRPSRDFFYEADEKGKVINVYRILHATETLKQSTYSTYN